MNRMLSAMLLAIGLVGCGRVGETGTDTANGVTVTDSAGVEIVDNHSPAWVEADAWTVGTDPLFILRALDDSEENGLIDPTSIDVDSQGRTIVADGNQVGWNAVLVYDSLGRFDFQVGREGEGPGEFGQLWWASAYRGDSIIAFDMRGDRLSVFTPEGDFVRAFRPPPLQVPPPPQGTMGYTEGADAAYGDGYILAYPRGRVEIEGGPGPAWFKHLLVRLDPTGEVWDTLGSFEISQQYWTGTQQEQLWFAPLSVRAVGHDVLYFGSGARYEIGVFDESGRQLRIIRRSHEPRPVTEELKVQLREWFLDRMRTSPRVTEQSLERAARQFDEGRYTEWLPPYSAILLDPAGYLWVENFRWIIDDERAPVSGPTAWSVFDPEGRWLGDVETPEGFILRAITEDRILGFVIDEFDVKEVYAYALHRGG